MKGHHEIQNRLHRCGKLAQSLVEIVHLRQDADCGQDDEHVSRWVCKLVLSSHSQFHRNSESLDRHNRNSADSRANRQVNKGVLLPVLGCNSIYHNDCKNHHCGAEQQKASTVKLARIFAKSTSTRETYQVGSRNGESHR
jgi:hypothetical protein